MRIHPSANLSESNLSIYAGSTPKAPMDPGTAEFVKGKPPITQAARNNAYYIARLQQHLADFDRDLAEWKESGEWRKEYKTWGAACELALNMAQQSANRIIRKYKESSESLSVTTEPKCSAEPDTDKADTLETVNSMSNPLADLEADLAASVKPPAPEATQSAPAPKPVPEAEHKPRVRNDNGKPVYALPVWRELTEAIGRAINRNDAVNGLLRSPEDHKFIHDELSKAFNRAEAWHEKAKHA